MLQIASARRLSLAGAPALLRLFMIGLISFLTLVDLFATQAILPSLAVRYAVSPAAMGLAVNASTAGMAAAGLAVALLGRGVPRRLGVSLSLVLLAVPTVLLASAPDLATFAALRVAQGLCMATAFTLTMAYLAEAGSATDTGSALAAYITGNVASNLFGRMMAAAFVDLVGLSSSFHLFALLNVLGALAAWWGLRRCAGMSAPPLAGGSPLAAWRAHFANLPLCAGFAVGFLILFVFIGTFTYVNFVLARPPVALSPMHLGLVYLVFLPALVTTPFAGSTARRFGTPAACGVGLATALAGLPLLLLPQLPAVLIGLALVGVGTFFAQAVATGFIGRAATRDPGSASGLYLASYYLGGLAGSAVLGQVFDRAGWPWTVLLAAAALLLALAMATRLRPRVVP